jgi:acyl-CoA thioester hydrolase
MTPPHGQLRFRVRYCDTDQMKTYYNARVLEWFETGRTELLRSLGKPYREWERDGVFLPVTETYVKFDARAEYDDELVITTTMSMVSRVRLRCDCRIERADSGEQVCSGYTVHVLTDASGKPIRPPRWVVQLVDGYLAAQTQPQRQTEPRP